MPSLSSLITCLLAMSALPVMGKPLGNPSPKSSEDIFNFDRGLVGRTADNKPKDLLSEKTLTLCDQAPNCEIYEHPDYGKLIRFVKGMEPGSAHYNATVVAADEKRVKNGNSTTIAKRDWSDTTNFEGGHNVLNWGNVQPQVVLNNLYNPCQYSSCDSGPVYYATTAVRDLGWGDGSTAPSWFSIIFTATAQYNGWDERNYYIESIKTMSEKGQSWTYQHWSWGVFSGDQWTSDSGDQWEIRQSDFFSINQFSPDNYMKGFMQVYIYSDWGEKGDWGCARVNDFIKDAISAINPWAGAFWGVIRPECK